MEVEPARYRLRLNVLAHNVHRDAECRCGVIMDAAKVDETVFHAETMVAGHLVLQPGARGPSGPPVAHGKAVGAGGSMPRHIDVSASPSSLGVDKPLIGRKA